MNAYATPHVRDFISHFPDARGIGGGRFKVRCCCHDDQNPSATITITGDGTILYYCQSCKAKGADAVKELGLPMSALFTPKPRDYRAHVNGHKAKPTMKTAKPKTLHPTRERAIEAAKFGVSQYAKVPIEKLAVADDAIYQRADGSEHFSIIRFIVPTDDGSKPEKYPQPIHAVPGGYHCGDPAGLLSLMNLPDVLASDDTIFHFEGETKVKLAKSLGLLATTSSHGSNSADKTDFTPVVSRQVVIVPDADEAGEEYAQVVAEKYLANGCTVKILRLPGLNEGDDIVEFVENLRQSGIEDADDAFIGDEIRRLAAAVPIYTVPIGTLTDEDGVGDEQADALTDSDSEFQGGDEPILDPRNPLDIAKRIRAANEPHMLSHIGGSKSRGCGRRAVVRLMSGGPASRR
jgi:hypothetical protein